MEGPRPNQPGPKIPKIAITIATSAIKSGSAVTVVPELGQASEALMKITAGHAGRARSEAPSPMTKARSVKPSCSAPVMCQRRRILSPQADD